MPSARRALRLVLALLLLPAAAAAAPCPGCLRAGAASVALVVPAGTPLAGYGGLARRLLVPDLLGRHAHAFWFRPHAGALDELRARALVVDSGDARLVWVSADLVAVGRDFTERLERRLREAGVPVGALLVSASHTHSGPGAFIDSALMGFIAADREDEAVRDALLDGLVEAVRRAHAARTDARVSAAVARADGLTTGRLGHAPDPGLVVVKLVAAGGAPLAALWNYAIHGTMLGPRNLSLSGDVMGLASALVERALGVPALFVNGAVGDVSPSRHGLEQARAAAGALAQAVLAAWQAAPAPRAAPLVLARTRVRLPAPRLSLRNCLGRFVPRSLTVPLDGAFPADAEVHAGRLGDAAWVTVPGELQAKLGQGLRRQGGAATVVAGLTNDYLGYFVTAADYDAVTYVTCATLYGPAAGERLAEAAGGLLRDLPEGTR